MNLSAVDNLWLWGGVFIWLGVLTALLIWLITRYRQLVSGRDGKSLEKLILENKRESQTNQQKAKQIKEELKVLEKRLGFCIQKVGLVRYNPFLQTGGDQSFSLALLDGEEIGFVITSLHTREGTRVYAKVVEEGKAKDKSFSKEEQEAIKKAKK